MGCGWQKDLEFKITKTTCLQDGTVIYWGGRHANGVFEDFLQPVTTDWDKEKNDTI